MIGILDYGSGNIASVCNAVTSLGFQIKKITTANDLKKIKKVIFPGQGRAGSVMKELERKCMTQEIRDLTIPFLGICVGMHILTNHTEEDNTTCFGVLDTETKKYSSPILQIPQIGWNRVQFLLPSTLTENLRSGEFFYFANSYYVKPNWQTTIGVGLHITSFSAIEQRENFYAVQFHPEKSANAGMTLLKNFCTKC